MRGKLLFRVLLAGLMLMALVMAGCEGDDGDDGVAGPPGPPGAPGAPGADASVAPLVPTILVKDTAGLAVEGATVYAIPAADVAELATVPLTLEAGNYSDEAKTVDEPLEDLINANFTPTSGGVNNYISAKTDANGEAVLADLQVGDTDMYFIYVAPASTDTGRLPGGSMSRDAVSGASLDMTLTAVEVSTAPSTTGTYVGSSACLACHRSYTTQTQTAHRHGIMVAGKPGPLQDVEAEFGPTTDVYDYFAGLDMFTAGTPDIYTDGVITTPGTGGTTVWFYDFDALRGFDKFKTLTSAPATGTTVYATVRAYQEPNLDTVDDTTDVKYMMQFTNVINPADPKNGMIREALMNYGGGVYKQRYLTSYSDTADNGFSDSLYMLPLQFNSSGDDAAADRTRKVFRDYHLDYWMTGLDTVTPTFKDLPDASKSFDLNCASCHFTGFNISKNATTGEYSAEGANVIAGGEIHPLTGLQQELNNGCETCHGPGSEHISAGGNGAAIVTPGNLTAERESVICGQCHSRPKGTYDGITSNDSPLNADGKMLFPGTSRADYLANHTSRNDATTSDLWADQHSKSHHQQYTDFIASSKYRNGSSLKTCTSCHDVHAPGTDRHQLNGTSDNSLCISCHAAQSDVPAHMTEKTGFSMDIGQLVTLCIDCHSTKTAKSGAGETVGKAGASGTIYYQNDISSHRLDVPLKSDTSPTNAMPVPYTNTCGLCHVLSAPL
ncbi:MAG: cytochrome c3 family protein [Desulfuromonadales bacterium]